jgi:hypothetical protein
MSDPVVGDPGPPLALPTLDSERFDLRDLRGLRGRCWCRSCGTSGNWSAGRTS